VKMFGDGRVGRRVIDGISLEVEAGEFVAITGPSGSGKSTLLMLLGLLAYPTSGQILLRGRVVPTSPRSLRILRATELGFVFQKPNLLPFLTAAENVELPLILAGLDHENRSSRVESLLSRFEVWDRRDAHPSQLSGGEQQRVAIARALAYDPSVVLADEPTAALDATRGRQIVTTLAATAHEDGAAVIMVTHDPRALPLCDRVLELAEGRLS